MTNRLALILGFFIIVTIAFDQVLDWGLTIFLGQELLKLVDYLAVWR